MHRSDKKYSILEKLIPDLARTSLVLSDLAPNCTISTKCSIGACGFMPFSRASKQNELG